MKILALHPNFTMPKVATSGSGAYDLFMPEAGSIDGDAIIIPLGFSLEVPKSHVALLLPRSGAGAKFSVELNNTVGVIDSDYRGEWMASMRTKNSVPFGWNAGDRVLQFMLVPIITPPLELVTSLSDTDRGTGGFGSSGR